MHGEYKMPGGKLVVADLEVGAGKFRHVQISGDFFLEPDSALDVINAALEGQAADTDARQLARAIEHRLDAGVVLYGISPAAVATAVRRALGNAA